MSLVQSHIEPFVSNLTHSRVKKDSEEYGILDDIIFYYCYYIVRTEHPSRSSSVILARLCFNRTKTIGA